VKFLICARTKEGAEQIAKRYGLKEWEWRDWDAKEPEETPKVWIDEANGILTGISIPPMNWNEGQFS
jgi:hypothetical protein